MQTQEMGRVTTEATIENIGNLWDAKNGRISVDDVRRITIGNALVDTGATLLSLPTRYIQQLGLAKTGQRRVTSSTLGATSCMGCSTAFIGCTPRLHVIGPTGRVT